MSSTIANPLRRLSAAAIRVRRGAKEREEIPDFSIRQDEIGNLSIALREMTTALYDRIDAIESFAADVSHELKNPLTSLRSAVETLPLAKTDQSRQRLMDIIQHDVRRLDRLISDISDASRIDAQLAKANFEPIDMGDMIEQLLETRESRSADGTVRIAFARPRKGITVITLPAKAPDPDPLDCGVFGNVKREWERQVWQERLNWDQQCQLAIQMQGAEGAGMAMVGPVGFKRVLCQRRLHPQPAQQQHPDCQRGTTHRPLWKGRHQRPSL